MSSASSSSIVPHRGVRGRPGLQLDSSVGRELIAKGHTKQAIVDGDIKKGNVMEASTIAAIQAVKDTPRIIPHCHPIPLEGTKVEWTWEGNDLWCQVEVSAHYKTGIEMEALTGVAAGLLCAFDMVKSSEKDHDGQYPTAVLTDLCVVEKFKGSSTA